MSNHFSRFSSLWPLLLWTTTLSPCQTQARGLLCNGGDGKFDAEFRTDIKLHVGAARNGELATRSCAATLAWEKQDLVIATGAAQIDVDAFGVDLGDGIPTAAFQIKKAADDCCMEYAIYSLQKPPRLLRRITGGEFFRASDVDLDGSVEIWSNDAAALNGFENLTLSELDSAPSIVFRFVHGRLLDVSAEFQSYFDDEIAKVRGGIPRPDIEEFKASDGKLIAAPSISAERLHRLRMTKIKVLEMVWAYLYSGRESDAWRSLGEMWPPKDLERIREALVNARAHGIHGQADGTTAGPPREKKKRVQIYDAASPRLEVVPPRSILLQRPPLSEAQKQELPESELTLDLVVDAAGKVRSAELSGKTKTSDPELINSAFTWKFIPAFKAGRPVASRLRLAVSLRQ